MQKFIAVVNHRMDDDELAQLIAKDVAGALFEISHQNYPMAAKIISQIRALSSQTNRPISLIQDITKMTDPLDLEFGLRAGVDCLTTDKEEHVKIAKGLDKLVHVIFKGRNLPKGVRVDSVMSSNFVDPDAHVLGEVHGDIKHLIGEHQNQSLLDALLHVANRAGATHIVVDDLDIAKNLSWRRPQRKIIFAPRDPKLASKGAILWGVHPVFRGPDIVANLQNMGLADRGSRVVDASNIKHVSVQLV